MNAVSELIKNRRKLVRDVACLAAEGRLFQRTAPLKAKLFLYQLVRGNGMVLQAYYKNRANCKK